MIGCGVLALSWSIAQLGWVGGPVAMVCFAFVTYISAFLLSHCYRSPDLEKRQRNYTCMDAVRTHLGSCCPFSNHEALRPFFTNVFVSYSTIMSTTFFKGTFFVLSVQKVEIC